jgi:hypothetical protein
MARQRLDQHHLVLLTVNPGKAEEGD